MFAAQSYGVTPDIIYSGKGVSSGAVPLGTTIARQSMADAFYGKPEDNIQFAHGHTFAGNPLACSAGIAVIDEIVEKGLLERARKLGQLLSDRLEKLEKYGVVREVRGRGLLRGVERVRDNGSMEPFSELGKALKNTALKNGLIMRIDLSWFALAPALICAEADIEELGDLVERSLQDALKTVKR